MNRLASNGIKWAVLVAAVTALGFASGQKSPAAKGAHPFANKNKNLKLAAKSSANRTSSATDKQLIVQRLNRWRQGLTRQSYSGATAVQNDAIAKLAQISERTLKINWDKTLGTPIFMSGKTLQSAETAPARAVTADVAADRAMKFMRDNKKLLRIENPIDEFVMNRTEHDDLGMTHIRYQQIYRGLEVWGRDVVVHLNRDGQVESFNGRYIRTPSNVGDVVGTVAEPAVRATAEREFGKIAQKIYSRRLIYVDQKNQALLAWLVNIKGALDENWHYFIDAKSGAILHRYNHVMYDGPVAGSGVDLNNETRNLSVYQIGAEFFLIDASKPMFNAPGSTFPGGAKGVVYVFDAKNGDGRQLSYVKANSATGFNANNAVSAAANGALVYDYYNQRHNRNAIDGNGTSMKLVVNLDNNLNNAFWNGESMSFGNGDGNDFRDLAASYDVTGHEMTHGVVENTANLVYEFQPGALNESFADVFGTLFEFYARPGTANYLMGEDVTTPNIAGDCLRNMEDPAASNVAFDGQQPTKMSEFRNLPNTDQGDNGGVHINSGIPNRAFVIIHKAVGNDKVEQIYYRALSLYLTRSSKFIDARLAIVKAAEDLFGANSAESNACKTAFDTVEILEGNPTPPPQPDPAVQGNEYLALVDANDLSLYRGDLANNTIDQLTTTPVLLFSRPTVSDDGSTILFVDAGNFVRAIDSDGQNEQVISSDGIWSVIALSPDGTKLAANTIDVDTTIWVFDFVNATSTPYKLYTPTYSQDVKAGNVLYADVLDWASDNTTVMYDAFNFNVDSNGDTLEYWDINVLNTSDGSIERLFPPQPTGVDLGNPTFASNTDNIIALDYFGLDGNVTVLGVNLNTGDEAQITNNFGSPGRPSFSRDDNRVYYHFITNTSVETWFVNLLADGITGDGQDQLLIENFYLPTDFAIGTRPTDVEDAPGARPLAFELDQNYPNPFNPETSIRYNLPVAGDVALRIYDLMGREMALIESGRKSAGEHFAVWNGKDASGKPAASGIYFYRLEARSSSGTKTLLTKKMTLLK